MMWQEAPASTSMAVPSISVHSVDSDSSFEPHSDQEKTFADLESCRLPGESCSGASTSASARDVLQNLFSDMDYAPAAKRARIDNDEHGEGTSFTEMIPDAELRTDGSEDLYDYYYAIDNCDPQFLQQLEEKIMDEDSELNRTDRRISAEVERLIAEEEDELRRRKQDKLRKRTLERALARANKEKRLFCCFVCNKAFVDEESVRRHVNDIHLKSNEDFKHKCPHCYMRFKKGHHFRRHVATHDYSINGRFTCDKCGEGFREELNLKIHLSREHSMTIDYDDIKKLLACECGQTFGVPEEYKRHRYYCENKEKILERRKQLKEQVRLGSTLASPASAYSDASKSTTDSTTGGRSTKDKSCPYCLDIFASIQSRDRHIGRKHPEQKNNNEHTVHTYTVVDSPDLPYACTMCQKRFATHASLSLHKKRIHEKKLDHVCQHCQKGYPIASELRKHIKRVHEDKNSSPDNFFTF